MAFGKKAKQAFIIGLALAVAGVFYVGAFGLPAFLSAAPGVGGGKAASLWDAAFNSGSDTDRTETEIIAPDGYTVYYYLADVQMDGLGDIDLEADVWNLNTEGETTNVWDLSISIVSVGTVIVSGIPTPVANYTADRTRFNIAYSLTTAGAPTIVQVHDTAESHDWTSGASDELNMDMPIDPAVVDDVPSGGSFKLVYSVGGITLTAILQEP